MNSTFTHTMTIQQISQLSRVAQAEGKKIINKYVGPLPSRVEYKFVKEDK